ncbi:unnamed protein product [Pedinophyceae sp. YPF-701]|nr:unnamed protein product [Pedinophyceae sp. YPF-701]
MDPFGRGEHQGPPRPAPARGAVAGARADALAKKAGNGWDMNEFGHAWTHGYLQKKPWHPLNFRNQMVRYEREQAAYEREQRNERARRELEAENQRLQDIALLPTKEAERIRSLRELSFMYAKPPGYDAAVERDKAKDSAPADQPAADPAAAAAPQPHTGAREQARTSVNFNPDALKGLISLRATLAGQRELQMGLGGLLGRSPPRGGVAADAANQRFVLSLGDDDAAPAEPAAPAARVRLPRRQRRELVKALSELEAAAATGDAEAVDASRLLRTTLVQSGVDVDALLRRRRRREDRRARKRARRDGKQRRRGSGTGGARRQRRVHVVEQRAVGPRRPPPGAVPGRVATAARGRRGPAAGRRAAAVAVPAAGRVARAAGARGAGGCARSWRGRPGG